MQISSRFTIAIHIFACIDAFEDEYKITSDFLADSVNVNPVVIRKILSQLKGAGLIDVRRGSGGASIAKPKDEITLLIYTERWTAWKTANCSIYMRILIRTALWEKTSTVF